MCRRVMDCPQASDAGPIVPSRLTRFDVTRHPSPRGGRSARHGAETGDTSDSRSGDTPDPRRRGGVSSYQHVYGADAALVDGLNMLRDMLSTAIRGEGGVPRTRGRPHSNEAPTRHIGAGNAGPMNGRPSGKPGGAGLIEEDTVPLTKGLPPPSKVGEPLGGGTGTPPPARPDPGDAAAEVWALIERAQAGDGGAFGSLYDRYFDTVFRFVYFRVGNRQLAEDLTADTFLRAL